MAAGIIQKIGVQRYLTFKVADPLFPFGPEFVLVRQV